MTILYYVLIFPMQLNCLNQSKIDEILGNVNSSSDYCLPKKTRVILLVIDALKYEFGVYDKRELCYMPPLESPIHQ